MEILVILILVLFNSFFALCEIALVSVRKNRIEHLVEEGKKNAKTTLELINNPESFLSSIQVGITLVGIIAGAYGGVNLTDDMEAFLTRFTWLEPYTPQVAIILVVGGITYLSIVVGELVPKSIALSHAYAIALFCAPIIKFFSIVAYPFVKVLSFSTRLIVKLLRIKPSRDTYMTEDELRFMIKTARTQGILHKEESAVHQSLFTFTDQTARSLMTHRTEVEWIDINKPMLETYEQVIKSVHSKFPVCADSLDKILGFITVKEFLANYLKGNLNLKKIVQEPVYLPQSVLAFTILSIFKRKKMYFGIVIDEFGSLTGIVTLHDLTEGLVGNLPEVNEEEYNIRKLDDYSYLLAGDTLILDINRYFEEEIIEDKPADYVTISGFILSKLEELPKAGEKIDHNGWRFEVAGTDENKIKKVLMKKKRHSGH